MEKDASQKPLMIMTKTIRNDRRSSHAIVRYKPAITRDDNASRGDASSLESTTFAVGEFRHVTVATGS